MAVSVVSAAGAVATKADAAPKPDPYTVRVGQNAQWTAKAYNWHKKGASGYALHAESSVGPSLAAKVNGKNGQNGESWARLAVKFHIAGVKTQAQWQAIWNKPVRITAVTAYKLSATNTGTATASSLVLLEGGLPQGNPTYEVGSSTATIDFVRPPATAASKMRTATTSKDTTLAYLRTQTTSGTDIPGECLIRVALTSKAATGAGTSAQASGTATVSSISLTWL